MSNAILSRFTIKSETQNGTFGALKLNGESLCITCEPPWDDNQHGISCIPEGTYHCVKHNSTAHPDTWAVTNVPNRTSILIHSGNTIKDTQGCILVGKSYGELGGLPAVLDSRLAMNLLRKRLPDEFDLTIEWETYE